MAYTDPYTSNQPEQQMEGTNVGDLLATPFKPSTYLYPYTMWPGMYSNKKGISTPFETRGSKWIESFQKAFTKTNPYGKFLPDAGIWTEGRTFGITSTTAKTAVGELWKLGPFGKGHRRFENNLGKIEHLKSKLNRANSLLEKLNTKQEYINKRRPDIYKKISRKLSTGGNELSSLTEMGNLTKSEAILDVRKASLLKTTGLIKSALKARNSAKWLIRGAKAGSWIGLSMLAWDIASAVGKPLVGAAINAVGAMAKAYQTRFMPEMGAQLQMSYLSQGAATERQRAISAMSKAYINGRSAFGSEGQMYHQ